MSIFQRYGLKYSLSFLLGQERFSTHGGAPEHPDFCEGITHTVRVIKRSKNNGGMARNDRPINLEEDCWIGKNSKVDKKFNISTNHLHYNKTAVNALMSSNHFKLTILRNPESQFVSSFKVTSIFHQKYFVEILKTWPKFKIFIDLFSIITIYFRNWRLN